MKYYPSLVLSALCLFAHADGSGDPNLCASLLARQIRGEAGQFRPLSELKAKLQPYARATLLLQLGSRPSVAKQTAALERPADSSVEIVRSSASIDDQAYAVIRGAAADLIHARDGLISLHPWARFQIMGGQMVAEPFRLPLPSVNVEVGVGAEIESAETRIKALTTDSYVLFNGGAKDLRFVYPRRDLDALGDAALIELGLEVKDCGPGAGGVLTCIQAHRATSETTVLRTPDEYILSAGAFDRVRTLGDRHRGQMTWRSELARSLEQELERCGEDVCITHDSVETHLRRVKNGLLGRALDAVAKAARLDLKATPNLLEAWTHAGANTLDPESQRRFLDRLRRAGATPPKSDGRQLLEFLRTGKSAYVVVERFALALQMIAQGFEPESNVETFDLAQVERTIARLDGRLAAAGPKAPPPIDLATPGNEPVEAPATKASASATPILGVRWAIIEFLRGRTLMNLSGSGQLALVFPYLLGDVAAPERFATWNAKLSAIALKPSDYSGSEKGHTALARLIAAVQVLAAATRERGQIPSDLQHLLERIDGVANVPARSPSVVDQTEPPAIKKRSPAANRSRLAIDPILAFLAHREIAGSDTSVNLLDAFIARIEALNLRPRQAAEIITDLRNLKFTPDDYEQVVSLKDKAPAWTRLARGWTEFQILMGGERFENDEITRESVEEALEIYYASLRSLTFKAAVPVDRVHNDDFAKAAPLVFAFLRERTGLGLAGPGSLKTAFVHALATIVSEENLSIWRHAVDQVKSLDYELAPKIISAQARIMGAWRVLATSIDHRFKDLDVTENTVRDAIAQLAARAKLPTPPTEAKTAPDEVERQDARALVPPANLESLADFMRPLAASVEPMAAADQDLVLNFLREKTSAELLSQSFGVRLAFGRLTDALTIERHEAEGFRQQLKFLEFERDDLDKLSRPGGQPAQIRLARAFRLLQFLVDVGGLNQPLVEGSIRRTILEINSALKKEARGLPDAPPGLSPSARESLRGDGLNDAEITTMLAHWRGPVITKPLPRSSAAWTMIFRAGHGSAVAADDQGYAFEYDARTHRLTRAIVDPEVHVKFFRIAAAQTKISPELLEFRLNLKRGENKQLFEALIVEPATVLKLKLLHRLTVADLKAKLADLSLASLNRGGQISLRGTAETERYLLTVDLRADSVRLVDFQAE